MIQEYPRILQTWTPAMDITEDATEIVVLAEVPGMEAKNIELTVAGDTLKIAGQKKEEHRDRGKDYYRLERKYGVFERIVKLPAEVDSDHVSAECRHGVLRIRMAKLHPVEPRKVKIEAREE